MGFIIRRLASLLFISVIILGLGFVFAEKFKPESRNYYIPALKPCRNPIKYAMGEIDPRFEISREKLVSILKESENIWETNSRLGLFQYQPEAELKIRLIYDERQQQTNEAEQIEASLKNLDAQRLNLEKQQSAISGEYEKKLALFKAAVKKYEDHVEEYNKDVFRWNSQGGTSEGEYNKLKKEEKDLKKEFEELKEKELELNALAKKSNTIIDQENKIIGSYNQTVTTYKSKFGNAQEFEKGVFDPAAGIAIYQFKEISDLKLTLIHELGHALGINHVENPQSIMYYLMGEQDLDNPALTQEDLSALKAICQL